jgi:hypothetical protein
VLSWYEPVDLAGFKTKIIKKNIKKNKE